MIHEIWSEGFIATGQSEKAMFRGKYEGKTFKDSIINWIEKDKDAKQYVDLDRMTYWGCRLFNNESDARKSFG